MTVISKWNSAPLAFTCHHILFTSVLPSRCIFALSLETRFIKVYKFCLVKVPAMPASFLSLRLMATTLDDQFVTQACTYKLQMQLHTMVPPVLQHLIFYLSFSISLCLSPFTFSEGVSFSRSLHSAGSHTCSQSPPTSCL